MCRWRNEQLQSTWDLRDQGHVFVQRGVDGMVVWEAYFFLCVFVQLGVDGVVVWGGVFFVFVQRGVDSVVVWGQLVFKVLYIVTFI